MSISVLGPTFEDLAVNVKKNISNISYIFVGRSGGYIGGSLLGGILFDCINPHLLLGNSSPHGVVGEVVCRGASQFKQLLALFQVEQVICSCLVSVSMTCNLCLWPAHPLALHNSFL